MSAEVNDVLNSLKLQEYIKLFKENDLDDEAIKFFISNGSITTALKEVIRSAKWRTMFITIFTERYCNDGDGVTTLQVTSTSNTNDTPSTSQEVTRATVGHPSFGEQEASSSIQRGITSQVQSQLVQIIGIESHSREVVFFEDAFSNILSSTESRPITIFTTVGPPKSGKSGFLDDVINHIRGESQEQSLKRFSSESSGRCGIWMYPTPLIIKSKRDGSEIVVLLMETRGVFDENNRHKDWEKLLGLSLITSSCLILNLLKDIEENKLDLLQPFFSFGISTYHEKVMIQNKIHKAYQKLVFLIRDWDKPTEHPYGSKGGDSFISSRHSTSTTSTLGKLKQCFEEVACFLIPNRPASSDPIFSDTVKTAIAELINTSKLPSKNIYGNILTGQDFKDFFKAYVNLLNEEERLDEDALYVRTFQCCCAIVLRKCESFFNKSVEPLKKLSETAYITDEDICAHYQETEKNTLRVFRISDKMGSKSAMEKVEEDLRERIQTLFEPVKLQVLERRERILADAHKEAANEYLRGMKEIDSIKNKFSDDQLQKMSTLAEEKSKIVFGSRLNLKNPDSLLMEKRKLCNAIEEEFKKITSSYRRRRAEEENEMEDQVEGLVEIYRIDMKRQAQGQFPSDFEISGFHETSYQKCFKIISKNKSSSPLYDQGRKDLETRLKNELHVFRKNLRTDEENMKKECEELLVLAVNLYSDKLRSLALTNRMDYEASHSLAKADAITTIQERSDRTPSKELSQLLEKLESKIEINKLKLQLEISRNTKDAENSIKNAGKEAKNNYKQGMNTFVNQIKGPIAETELVAQHGTEKAKAISKFQNSIENSSRTTKDFETALDDLKDEIDILFVEYKSQNELKLQQFESTASAQLSQVKLTYEEEMRRNVSDSSTEDILKQKETSARAEAIDMLCAQLDPEVVQAKPEYKQKMIEELTRLLDASFKECLDDFKTKMKEDEIALKFAFDEAKKYYNEEMGKRICGKSWLESDELDRINAELVEITIANIKNDLPIEDNQVENLRAAMKVLYLKYEEENLQRYPVDNPAIGIDLGTTYSCVGVFINGQVKIIPDQDVGEVKTVPSYVAFDGQNIIVGEAAKEKAFLDPANTIFDAKRLIGRAFNDPIVQKDIKLWPFEVVDDNGMPKIKVRGNTYRPEQISAHVIIKMKQIAENYLKKPVQKAVVTVPAYFNDGQRQATRDAAEIAGLEATILNEPTAAAIAYKLHRTDDLKRNVLVFDLGGGTFDVAVLEMKQGEIHVKAIGGDTHLGGEDFDNNMVTALIERVKAKSNKDLGRDRESSNTFEKAKAAKRLRRMRDQCEKAKRSLSSAPTCAIVIDVIDENFDLNETFKREEFEKLNNDLFEKCIRIVKSVLEDAKMEKTEVDDIVLVGGSTRIPKVRELLKQFFDGKRELCSTLNADEAVARGAAIQAALLHGKQAVGIKNGIKLFDVAPLSLGIEIVTGALSVVIPRNSPIPCSHTEIFQTVTDNQTSVSFKVYEGEMPLAKDNNFLGKFLLTNIPKDRAGKEPLDCTMTISSEGILNCKAVTRSSGESSEIRIETYNGRMASKDIEKAKREVNAH